jgi:hypothetical protein
LGLSVQSEARGPSAPDASQLKCAANFGFGVKAATSFGRSNMPLESRSRKASTSVAGNKAANIGSTDLLQFRVERYRGIKSGSRVSKRRGHGSPSADGAASRRRSNVTCQVVRQSGKPVGYALRSTTTSPVIGNPFLYSWTALSIVSTSKPLAIAVSTI